MKIVATLTLLHLSLCATAAVSGSDSTETALTAAPGDTALLPCYAVGNVTPTVTTWMKNGQALVAGGESSPGPSPVGGERLSVLHDGSLSIRGVTPGDEGTYTCSSTLPGNNIFHARVLLRVA
ncbi:hemicentin-2-like, partial [Plectropomus leopardus]|uniref:hemicentin-2-like n=1 Tax=Plectropomus leopardus TaxID=160734 RepID=UPI001C4CCC72